MFRVNAVHYVFGVFCRAPFVAVFRPWEQPATATSHVLAEAAQSRRFGAIQPCAWEVSKRQVKGSAGYRQLRFSYQGHALGNGPLRP